MNARYLCLLRQGGNRYPANAWLRTTRPRLAPLRADGPRASASAQYLRETAGDQATPAPAATASARYPQSGRPGHAMRVYEWTGERPVPVGNRGRPGHACSYLLHADDFKSPRPATRRQVSAAVDGVEVHPPPLHIHTHTGMSARSKPPSKGASRADPYHARNTTPAFTVVRGPHRAAAALQITHTQRCGMAFNDFGWRIP